MDKYKCESCGAESPMCELCHKKPSVTGERATMQICKKCRDGLIERAGGIDAVLDMIYPMP